MGRMSIADLPTPHRNVRAFSAELRKAFTFPAISRTASFGVLILLIAAAFAIVQARAFVAEGRREELNGLAPQDLPLLLLHYGQVIPILLGAWVFGQDIPTGPRRTSLLATAQRGTLVTAKLLTAAIVGLVSGCLAAVCVLLPLLSVGDGDSGTVSIAPYAWLVGYWTLIATCAGALAAAVRNTTLATVPLLIWTVGLSDLISAKIPALSGALDQVFRRAYLPYGAPPAAIDLAIAFLQVAALCAIGAVATVRRDTH